MSAPRKTLSPQMETLLTQLAGMRDSQEDEETLKRQAALHVEQYVNARVDERVTAVVAEAEKRLRKLVIGT